MNFSILLYHASMHCWKDSSGVLLSSVITTILMAFTPLKYVWVWRKLKKHSHGEHQVNKEVVPVGWYFLVRNCRIFSYISDLHKSSGIIFQTLLFFISIRFVIIRTVKQRFLFTISLTQWKLNPDLLVESLLLLKSFFTPSQLSLNLFEHVCVTWYHIQNLLKYF